MSEQVMGAEQMRYGLDDVPKPVTAGLGIQHACPPRARRP